MAIIAAKAPDNAYGKILVVSPVTTPNLLVFVVDVTFLLEETELSAVYAEGVLVGTLDVVCDVV